MRAERLVAEREGYEIEIIRADMTKRLPFEDESFDMIFHPVSNCYVEKVEPIFRNVTGCWKKGGIFLGGYDIGTNFIFDEKEERIAHKLPYNPLKDKKLYEKKGLAANMATVFTYA